MKFTVFYDIIGLVSCLTLSHSIPQLPEVVSELKSQQNSTIKNERLRKIGQLFSESTFNRPQSKFNITIPQLSSQHDNSHESNTILRPIKKVLLTKKTAQSLPRIQKHRSSKRRKTNKQEQWLSKHLLNPENELFIAETKNATLIRNKNSVGGDKVVRQDLAILNSPVINRADWNPQLLQLNGYENFVRVLWGPSILHMVADPKLLAPTWGATLLNIKAVPQVLHAQFRPMVLSPGILPSLASVEFFPHILRAAFEPRVLSPRIWPNLIRIDNEAPEVLRVLFRPRVLSPDIDLQLFHIRVRTQVLKYNFEPRVLSPTIRLSLLNLSPNPAVLTRIEPGMNVLSPNVIHAVPLG